MGVTVHTRSPEETAELGERLGRVAFAGAVVLLEGPLGAGKTVFARGFARGLEAAGPVASPSFGILAVHPGRLTLFHLDLYRVESPAELRAVDLEEVFDSGGVAVVEWPRWLAGAPPSGALRVTIGFEGPDRRSCELAALDERWAVALGQLTAIEAENDQAPDASSRASGARKDVRGSRVDPLEGGA